MNPSISVLLSALNGAAILPKALDSVRQQTARDWECLIMDDGSTDETTKLLTSYAAQDHRFRLFHHARPRGLTLSLVELASEARGQFLARQDADDSSEPMRFEIQKAYLHNHPAVAVAACWFDVHNEEGDYLDTLKPFSSALLIQRTLRHKNPFAHGSLFMRKSAYDAVGGYRPFFRFAQDYDLLLRLSEHYCLSCVPQVLYHHRLSKTGIGREHRELQGAFAELARRAGEARRRQEREALSIQDIKPVAETRRLIPLEPEAWHLLKSGQRSKASGRMVQRNLVPWVRFVPTWLVRLFYQAHRLWDLR